MDNKLISMTDFVLKLERDPHYYESQIDFYEGESHDKFKIIRYANFLKQPLKLEMFVPVDRDGKAYDLKEVEAWKNHDYYSRFYKEELSFFEEAQEKVLFKGFDGAEEKRYFKISQETKTGLDWYIKIFKTNNKTIEDLIKQFNNIELTESALKQLQWNQ